MKTYKFKQQADYVFYLSEIIADTVKYKDRLNRYRLEVDNLFELNPDAKIVQTELYESISDKTKAIFYYIFNLLGDESKNAVSYRRFRKILIKNQKELNIKIENLSNEEAAISNLLNKHRNWGLHIPESLFVSKRKVLDLDASFIMEHCYKIPLPQFSYFEIEYLEKLKDDIDNVISAIEVLEKLMRKDYSKLIGKDFALYPDLMQVKPYKIMDIVKCISQHLIRR